MNFFSKKSEDVESFLDDKDLEKKKLDDEVFNDEKGKCAVSWFIYIHEYQEFFKEYINSSLDYCNYDIGDLLKNVEMSVEYYSNIENSIKKSENMLKDIQRSLSLYDNMRRMKARKDNQNNWELLMKMYLEHLYSQFVAKEHVISDASFARKGSQKNNTSFDSSEIVKLIEEHYDTIIKSSARVNQIKKKIEEHLKRKFFENKYKKDDIVDASIRSLDEKLNTLRKYVKEERTGVSTFAFSNPLGTKFGSSNKPTITLSGLTTK